LLGIERTNLHKKMRALGLSRDNQGQGPGPGSAAAVNRGLLAMAGTLGLTAVMLGAFGAHGLRDRLGAAMIEVYRTGVLYHLVHALACWRRARRRSACGRPRLVAGLFCAGIVFFSVTLYLLAITGMTWLGAVTPVGGLLLMAGWAAVLLDRLSALVAPRRRRGRGYCFFRQPALISRFARRAADGLTGYLRRHSAAAVPTSMHVRRPTPASSLR
jgi:uncharacterized membrane protein YgdD (TMEM256/DUF423 family)